MAVLVGALSGVIFGAGLVLGGMTQPGKVMAFLDFTGAWDPSLIFVMGGAILVYAPVFHLVVRERLPRYAREILVPKRRDIDPPLVMGAALFGVGWGLAGYCPGPGIVSLGTGSSPSLYFVGAMIAGMGLHALYARLHDAAGGAGEAPAGGGMPDASRTGT